MSVRQLLFAAALVLLAACSSTTEGGEQPVLPIEDVLEGGIVVTPDASGTSATVTVVTTVPLACAVAYGVDETFGSIATDDDMDGGAHTDHAPVLHGLRPETEYHYVLQGSDAAGNLYRSEVLTFTTPAASAPERPGPNVATGGRVVDVSSEFSSAFGGDRAVDGDPATAWSTAGDGDDASLTLELPEPTPVTGFGFRSRAMGDGSSIITRYEVTIDDGVVLGPFEASPDGLTVVEVDHTGQRFRFDAVASTGGNTGAVEIEIYGVP